MTLPIYFFLFWSCQIQNTNFIFWFVCHILGFVMAVGLLQMFWFIDQNKIINDIVNNPLALYSFTIDDGVQRACSDWKPFQAVNSEFLWNLAFAWVWHKHGSLNCSKLRPLARNYGAKLCVWFASAVSALRVACHVSKIMCALPPPSNSSCLFSGVSKLSFKSGTFPDYSNCKACRKEVYFFVLCLL